MKLTQIASMGVTTAQDIKAGVIQCDTPKSNQNQSTMLNNIITIKGKVTDENGVPLMGADVINLSNTQSSTITNADGDFTAIAKPTDTIKFHFLGFESITFIASSVPPIIKMNTKVNHLDEVVLVAPSKSTPRVEKNPSIKHFIEDNQTWIMLGIAVVSLGLTIYYNRKKVKKVKL